MGQLHPQFLAAQRLHMHRAVIVHEPLMIDGLFSASTSAWAIAPLNCGSLKGRPHPSHSRAEWEGRPQHQKRTFSDCKASVISGLCIRRSHLPVAGVHRDKVGSILYSKDPIAVWREANLLPQGKTWHPWGVDLDAAGTAFECDLDAPRRTEPVKSLHDASERRVIRDRRPSRKAARTAAPGRSGRPARPDRAGGRRSGPRRCRRR